MKKEDEHIDLLRGISREQPFNVPDGYFENFEERLQQRIQQESMSPREETRVIQLLKPILWFAAGLLLVFLLVHYPMSRFLPYYLSEKNQAEEEYTISIESLDDDTFYDMLSEDIHSENIETDDIMEYLAGELYDYEIYSELYN